eukprot:gene2339-2692_t
MAAKLWFPNRQKGSQFYRNPGRNDKVSTLLVWSLKGNAAEEENRGLCCCTAVLAAQSPLQFPHPVN